MNPLDFMDPEEAVGTIWHDYASTRGAAPTFSGAAATLDAMRASVSMMIHALRREGVAVSEAPVTPSKHRLTLARQLGNPQEMLPRAAFDGEKLSLPPVMDAFPDAALNRAAYLWLAAQAALADLSAISGDGTTREAAELTALAGAMGTARTLLPGLAQHIARMDAFVLQTRTRPTLPLAEARVETAIRAMLSGAMRPDIPDAPRARPYAPVPHWLRLEPVRRVTATERETETQKAPLGIATSTRKQALRDSRDEANRSDSFIMHRFEGILSWVESLNLNRMVDQSDDEDAAKAADDQDNITLSRHDQRAKSRLKLHLDMAPEDADHEAIADALTYPEWDAASRSYLPDHVRVLEAAPEARAPFRPDPARIARVRKQFEALRPRRIHRPRQVDGEELDIDALIASRADLIATGRASDRIYQSLRASERDLSVAILMDTSRSTESAVGETSVIEIARDALAALAVGIDASGDRLGIWGFSSLKRHRVFLSRCKGFDAPMGPPVIDRIGALTPGHYTRLGAAIRHTSARLDEETSRHRLLLVLTDGKPNDLDHYEGRHGIEDSHRAVREARARGQTVHGVIIDEDGQDWFSRIFGRGGFSLLPSPERLTRALPDIYRSLIQET